MPIKHGHNRKNNVTTPTYRCWASMMKRCKNANCADYPDYGGRGIIVCERWHDFRNFLADMGEKPNGHSLDRFPNNDGNYEPGNVRWATAQEQARNKRNNILLTLNGVTQCISAWSLATGLSGSLIWHRINKLGWTVEKALTAPVGQNKVLLSFDGETHCISEWSRIKQIELSALKARLSSGWSIEKALTTPLRPDRRRK